MEIMTGTPNMDTGAFREYFAPLENWLIKKNKEDNNHVYPINPIKRYFYD